MRTPKSQSLNFGSESDRGLDQPSLEVGLDILLGQGSGYDKPQTESIITNPVDVVRLGQREARNPARKPTPSWCIARNDQLLQLKHPVDQTDLTRSVTS